MKRQIIIKNSELLDLSFELTTTIKRYMESVNMLVNVGRQFGHRFFMSDGSVVFIHNTDNAVIVEKL